MSKLIFWPSLALASLFAVGCADSAGSAAAGNSDAATASDAASSTDSGGGSAPTGLIQLAQGSAEDLSVVLWSAQPLSVGWQRVYYRLQQAGQGLTEATLVQKPLMKMMNMQHACPVVQPGEKADAQGLFAGELLFQMAGNDAETWSLDLDVTAKGGSKRTVSLGKINVSAAPYAKTLLVGSGMTAERYTVIVHFAAPPKVGLNPYRVAVHRVSSDMLSFDPVSDATLKGTPEMPSMGHGSPGNVDPSGVGGGFYEGKLNLTMPGDWRLNLAVSLGGKSIGTAVFDWML